MSAFDIFAIIKDGKVVDTVHYVFNTGGYTQANVFALSKYGEGSFAVDITYWPVAIGDDYDGHDFYKNGQKVTKMPTEKEEISNLDSAVDDLVIAVLEPIV